MNRSNSEKASSSMASRPERSCSEFLRMCYAHRQGKNISYSLRAFARDLGVSASHLNKVINDKSRFSPAQASHIVERLGLVDADRDAFLHAILYSWIAKPSTRAKRKKAPDGKEFPRPNFELHGTD